MEADKELELYGVDQLFGKREDCLYAKCYCEENVWHLCDFVRREKPEELKSCFVAFVSNENKTIPLWSQSAGMDREGLVVWDYHVILVHCCSALTSFVYDLDSLLPFPCYFEEYFHKTIKLDQDTKEKYKRYFRITSASHFLMFFASNRDHMFDEDASRWIKPPPEWPCIKNEGGQANTIEKFWSMKPTTESDLLHNYSVLLNAEQFCQRFTFKTLK